MSDSDPRPDEEEPPEWAKERAREIAAADSADAGEPSDAEESADPDAERVPDIPRDAVTEAERLTRLARDAVDDAAATAYRERRDELVAAHDYEPRIREEDDTLVLYPAEWVEDGTVQFDRIEDTDRGVEVSLSGPGDAERYEEVASHNDAVADRIEREHGAAHAANVRAFGAFMANHYVKELDRATLDERAEFLEEYYPRNVWPDEEQRAVVEESLTLVDDALSE
ncbi:hypothetical protein GCM10027435_09480 [Haloparvum alkalitolerans]|uniref:DUF7108 domain-containing protein n=1 Tax=Haloparvum alkalitolerans TaxID=1042953 RepID=UPI003CFB8A8F